VRFPLRPGQLPKLAAVELRNWDAQPIDLGKRKLAPSQRSGDAMRQSEQSIRSILLATEQDFLEHRRFLAAEAAIAGSGAPDEHAIRSERRALGIDRNPAARQSPHIEPAHILESAIHAASSRKGRHP